jgi:hypothetical protein
VREAELVDECVNRSLLRALIRGDVSVAGVFGVAVYLVLDFFGSAAICFAAADYTTVALAYTRAKTTQDFTVLVSPAPDAKVCQ